MNATLTRDGELADEVRAVMHAQGFVLLRGVFEAALVDSLRMEIDEARVREEARFGREALAEVGQDGYVSDFLHIGPSVHALLSHEVLHLAVHALLGEAARLHVAQAIVLDPGKGRGIWPRCWHADMFQVREAVGDPAFCFGVNCLAIVDEMTELNGSTCLLPGSQGLKHMITSPAELVTSREHRTVAPAGSLLLIDGGTWHSAGLNRSLAPRRVIKLLFTRRWIRPQLDYASMSSPERVDLPAPVRRLLAE